MRRSFRKRRIDKQERGRKIATVINQYSVGLTLDAADYINKSKLTGAETRRMVRAIEDARTPAEKYARDLDRLSSAYQKGGIDTATYTRLTDNARQKMEAADRAAAKLAESHKATSNSMMTVGSHLKTMVAGYVGLQTVTKSIRMAADAEMAAASFEVLTGSIEGSRYMLGELRDLAAKTPLSFTGMQDAAKLMLAFNVPANEVLGSLKQLSDISLGNEQRFGMLALAFAQASAAGRLMGQDLLQMVNAGFNPLQEISKRTGESLTDLRKRMEAGKIGIEEVKQAFTDATSEGGKFDGMSDRIAQTMGGKMAIAASELEQGYIKVGQAFSSMIITMTNSIDDGASALDQFAWALGKSLDGIAFYIVGLQEVGHAVKQISKGEFTDAFSAPYLNKFLDMLDARDREREMMESTKATADSLNSVAEANLHTVEKAVEAEEQINEKLKARTEIVKSLGDRFAEIDEKVRKAEQQRIEKFNDDMMSALDAARQHFEREAQKWDRMRADVAQSPRGIESGSAEAASYLAQLENNRIGAAAMPERPTIGDQQLVEEAKRQFEEMQRQTQQNDRQLGLLRELLVEAKDNGFKRIR